MGWVIVNKKTRQAVCELFNSENVARLNTDKYEAVEAGRYLEDLNKKLNGGMTYRDKREAGLL